MVGRRSWVEMWKRCRAGGMELPGENVEMVSPEGVTAFWWWGMEIGGTLQKWGMVGPGEEWGFWAGGGKSRWAAIWAEARHFGERAGCGELPRGAGWRRRAEFT